MPTRANNSERELMLAWCAGFIDGEGFLGTSECTKKMKNGNNIRWFTVVLDVSQVKREPLEVVKKCLGSGSIRVDNNKGYGAYHTWRIYGDNAMRALELVLPYLINKRRQAELLIEFQKTKRNRWDNVSLETHARREAIHYELRALNAKRTRCDAERLSDESPIAKSEHAIVQPHGKNNRENRQEIDGRLAN